MNKYQEALQVLHYHTSDGAVNTLKELVDKTIPQDAQDRHYYWACGKCGGRIDKGSSYCKHCGQKVGKYV